MAPRASHGGLKYYDSDFSWESVRDEAEPILQARCLEARAALSGQPLASDARDSISKARPDTMCDAASDTMCDAAAAQIGAGGAWDQFHKQHSSAKFFAPKRYLLAAFPQLLVQKPPPLIAEVGCGNGAAILPVLTANPTAKAVVCDISPTALQLLRSAAETAGIQASRLQADVVEAATMTCPLLANVCADAVLLVFTLSAVLPERMAAVLQLASNCLRPGGLLLFRDYGLYDLSMMRFSPAKQLGPVLFRREDGTLSYFFSIEVLQALVAAAGFATEECRYCCIRTLNRKTEEVMQRVFVHGVFRRTP